MCTKADAALTVSNSVVFALFSLYGQSAGSNIQLSLTQLANGVHTAVQYMAPIQAGHHPPFRGGGTGFVPPSTGLFYFSVLTV